MYHQEFIPPQQLGAAIKCFWHSRRDVVEGQPSFEVVPDGYAELVFCFGCLHTLDVGGERVLLPPVFIIGLLGKPLTLHTEEALDVIGVRCFPWAVADLLGLPSGGGLQMLGHPVTALWPALEVLVHGGKITEAITLVKDQFMQSKPSADALLNKAGIAMQQANGSLPVKGVAEAAHATVRTLERRFKNSAGHSVKDVSALMRFEQVRNRLWTEPGTGLAALAAELGYTDQPHLSREFKRFSGSTPAAFARKAKLERPIFNSDIFTFV